MKKKFRTFSDARKFVHSLQLDSKKYWKEYYKSGKKPIDIPTGPNRTYKNKGWKGMGDWLGTGNRRGGWLSFEEARKLVQKLGIKTQTQYEKFSMSGKRSNDLPSLPERTYKNDWKGWGDFLGTGRIANQDRAFELYPPFKDAKKEYQRLAKKYGIKNRKQWFEFAKSDKMPKHLPKFPEAAYSKEKVLRRMKK